MKSEKEIREELQDCKEAMRDMSTGDDYYIFQGWVEALEFVLTPSPDNNKPRNNNYEPL